MTNLEKTIANLKKLNAEKDLETFIFETANSLPLLLEALEIMSEDLRKIADKETAGEDQKYSSYGYAFEGISDFAKEALEKIDKLFEGG